MLDNIIRKISKERHLEEPDLVEQKGGPSALAQRLQNAAGRAEATQGLVKQIARAQEAATQARKEEEEGALLSPSNRSARARASLETTTSVRSTTEPQAYKLMGFDERCQGMDQASSDESEAADFDEDYIAMLKNAKDAAAEDDKEKQAAARRTRGRSAASRDTALTLLSGGQTRLGGRDTVATRDTVAAIKSDDSKSPPRSPEIPEKIPGGLDPATAETQEGTPAKQSPDASAGPTPRVPEDDIGMDDDGDLVMMSGAHDMDGDDDVAERAAKKIAQLKLLAVHNPGIGNIMAHPQAPAPMSPQLARQIAARVRQKIQHHYEQKSENSEQMNIQEKLRLQKYIWRLGDDYTPDTDNKGKD